jgi:hypothetical protein
MEAEILQIVLFAFGIGFAAGFWIHMWISVRRRQAVKQRLAGIAPSGLAL